TVDLYLATSSRAGTFLMPDLVYRDYERVRRFFEARDFRLGSVKFEPYESMAPGIVLRQFPLAGHPLRRQDAISLVVVSPPAATS
ncbi:MAG: PASTA domain-containing protein, partial [Acidobacteria bacterium]|nr:PASTA domain-containing protein [Acidobacteriota bacterium]